MVSVYNSTAGISSTNLINRNDRAQHNAGSALASGKKINKASDDAASLAIATILSSDVSSLKQSATNLVQGTALLQTADGALEQAGNILGRMKSLATQANSGSLDPSAQTAINQEYQSLLGELNNLGTTTNFNGQNLVNGSFNQNFQSGSSATDTLNVDLSSVDLSSAGLGLTAGFGANPNALSTQGSAASTSNELDTAINNLSSFRSQVGSLQLGFSTRGDVVDTEIENTIAAQSALQDADIGKAQTDFTNSKLLTDLSIASAAQGKRMSSSLLQLVR
ncbi:MAG TPA: flagellin [Alphaproteobacteria bacterium]|nr:flagellin [Alphaproteobacteria bacterium]